MAMWLYQLSESEWSLNNYRMDIWEGERWEWEIGRKASASDVVPKPGDTVVFFYAPSNCDEPGFFGWAVISLWSNDDRQRFYFRPVAPSDRLKMHPFWNEDAKRMADEIRGTIKRGTLWPVSLELARRLGAAINTWVSGVEMPATADATT